MRYDDYDDYNRSYRSSGSSRRSSSSRSSGREYDRDSYRDRDYRDYRDYREDYDRSYYDRDRYSDRYSTRSSRDWYDDFDRSDWERTAPNWEDHGAARKKRTSSGGASRSSRPSSGGHGSSRSGSSSRNGSARSSQGSRNGSRRPSEGQQRRGSNNRRSAPQKQKSAMQFVPIILGLVVIILAALVIRSMLGGKGDYEISFSTESIVVGETATATLTGMDANDTTEPDIKWGSSENNVVSVEGEGLSCTLTAKSLGSATITAMLDGDKIASGTIQVVETSPGVKEIRVTEDEIKIYSGETYTIDATPVMEEGYTAPTIKWSSNDTSVAKVDSDGIITGQEVGKAIIKGVAGDKTVEITVEVVENPNSIPHQSSGDVGQEPEEGAEVPTNNNTTGTGSGNTTGGTDNTGTGGTGTSGTSGTGDSGSTDGQGGTSTGDNTSGTGSGE